MSFLDWIQPWADGNMVHCKKCKVELLPKKHTLKRHAKTNRHLAREMSAQTPQNASFTDEKMKQRQTEARIALYQALHNNMHASNHMLDILKATGNASTDFTLRRTKCACITMNVLAPIFRKFVITDMFSQQCSFYLDESTDVSGCSFLGK